MTSKHDLDRAEYLRGLLDSARPTTVYENTEWIDNAEIPAALARWDEAHGGLQKAVEASAERDARSAEGKRASSGNKFLREWATTGQCELDWAFLGAIPVKIDSKRKCRFDSITPDLLDDAAGYHEREARTNYGQSIILAGAFRAISKETRSRKLATVARVGDGSTIDMSEWRNTDPPLPGMDDDIIDADVLDDDE